MRVAAEFSEQIPHAFQRFQQMEGVNAASRALRHAIHNAQHDHGTMEPFHHAAGHNPHHAAVPALAPQDQSRIFVSHRVSRHCSTISCTMERSAVCRSAFNANSSVAMVRASSASAVRNMRTACPALSIRPKR